MRLELPSTSPSALNSFITHVWQDGRRGGRTRGRKDGLDGQGETTTGPKLFESGVRVAARVLLLGVFGAVEFWVAGKQDAVVVARVFESAW